MTQEAPSLSSPADPSLAVVRRTSVSAADFVALAKPRVTLVVLMTAVGGLFMAPVRASGATIAWTLLGTSLIVAGANALNMYLERDSDRFMARTATRPLPAGRMPAWMALAFGVLLSVAAVPVLMLGAHPVTAALAAFANLSYVFVYTPWKARSWTAVLVGAVPGAIPPLLGYTAATGTIDLVGLSLFAILFVWQVPHFHAIALFRQEAYARAGLQVLPGARGVPTTKLHIVMTTLLLAAVSFEPWWLGAVSRGYPIAALVLDIAFLGWALAGLRDSAGVRWARSYFGASIPWLVLIFAALLITKLSLRLPGAQRASAGEYGRRIWPGARRLATRKGVRLRSVLASLLVAASALMFASEGSVASAAPGRHASVQRAPYIAGRSVGSPNEGHLEGGVQLQTTSYLRVFPGHDSRWGLPDLVGLLDRSGHRVAQRFPGAIESVGDLSRRGGGDVMGHHSHESGRDADVGFYVVDRAGKQVLLSHIQAFDDEGRGVADRSLRFDDARNWALIESWLTDRTARVARIFVVEHIKARLLAHARRTGVPASLRAHADEVMVQPKGATHDDHFHVRIGCPRGQAGACVEHVTLPHRVARKAVASKSRSPSAPKSRPVLAQARKRGGSAGPKAPPMSGVVPAPHDFDDDREVVAGSDEEGELQIAR